MGSRLSETRSVIRVTGNHRRGGPDSQVFNSLFSNCTSQVLHLKKKTGGLPGIGTNSAFV